MFPVIESQHQFAELSHTHSPHNCAIKKIFSEEYYDDVKFKITKIMILKNDVIVVNIILNLAFIILIINILIVIIISNYSSMIIFIITLITFISFIITIMSIFSTVIFTFFYALPRLGRVRLFLYRNHGNFFSLTLSPHQQISHFLFLLFSDF